MVSEVVLVQPLFRSMNSETMSVSRPWQYDYSIMAWYDSENYFGIELVSGLILILMIILIF